MMQAFDDPRADLPQLLQLVLDAAQRSFPQRRYSGQMTSDPAQEDWQLRLFARTLEGESLPQHTLNLEIYCVKGERSLMLEYPEQTHYPILWIGSSLVWMEGDRGQTVPRPPLGESLEKLGRMILKAMAEA
ncbi:hypothetical protein [Lyngbya confervoides]|uniref:Uncharacterized protein n=1 Tax=Lyngbya confervoides BDU141951 TaxID=1574623 RepID=A0ABD4T5R2_9CYAN|nr:hypothetical protein [Lyngbya confervoides]MCM1983592.1 hypothetical protein [Lyngbya confervoides BDU141951]